MTTAQVIAAIKVMTAEEREQVAAFLRQYENAPVVQYADDRMVEETSHRIMGRHADLMRRLSS